MDEDETRPGKYLGLWMALESLAFLAGAALHSGLPWSYAAAQPPNIPAAIVETLCGLSLAWAAYSVLAGRVRARRAAVGAHLFSLGGVLLGIAVLALGLGPSTTLNEAYHSLVFISLFVMLGLIPARVPAEPLRTVSPGG